jgi:hypothetical protein
LKRSGTGQYPGVRYWKLEEGKVEFFSYKLFNYVNHSVIFSFGNQLVNLTNEMTRDICVGKAFEKLPNWGWVAAEATQLRSKITLKWRKPHIPHWIFLRFRDSPGERFEANGEHRSSIEWTTEYGGFGIMAHNFRTVTNSFGIVANNFGIATESLLTSTDILNAHSSSRLTVIFRLFFPRLSPLKSWSEDCSDRSLFVAEFIGFRPISVWICHRPIGVAVDRQRSKY